MQCQRCSKNEGEYLCSVCNRVVCQDCKVIDNGKVYCLDHVPKKELAPTETKGETKHSHKTLKELIVSDLILLVGVFIIFFISNNLIFNLVIGNFDVIKQNFPQLSFVFTLMAYFTSSSVYTIITLVIILIALIATLLYKKRKDKNI
jgi:hypothetical protein